MSQDEYQISEIKSDEVPNDLVIETKRPNIQPRSEESLEFHAARLLLLIKYAGGRKYKITGRTKMAKMDFFVRYPSYLSKALEYFPGHKIDKEVVNLPGKVKPLSLMIRYKYGPWDTKYYDVFALLVAKELITVGTSEDGDIFALTSKGMSATDDLVTPEFEEVIYRCKIVYSLFGSQTGTAIKKFIYDKFPEIVGMEMGKEIA